MNTTQLITDNAGRWARMSVLPNRLLEVERVSAALVAPNAKAIYQQVQVQVPAVPWWFVAIVHEREASQNFKCSIAQGDPWNKRSVHVPRGIGPFTSFVAAAVFTLTRCAPYPSKWADWSPGGVLTLFESYTATKIAGLATTFQFTFINNSGSSITPALSTKYPTTQDGSVTGGAAWGGSTADLSATNLTACTNGSTCTEAYTLTASASATAGYEFVVDFGAMASNSDTLTIGAGFDARATPGISTGINASPPSPEVLPPPLDIAWSQRFYTTSYGNNVAPGASTHVGIVLAGIEPVSATVISPMYLPFPVQMRAAPTIAYWDGAGNASKLSTTPASSSTTFTDNATNGGAAAFQTGPGGTLFQGYVASSTVNTYIQYTADASLWGG